MTRSATPRPLRARLLACATAVLAVAGCAVAQAQTAPPAPKTLYLTFDDGPGSDTAAILDVLAEHDAKAVFFTVGKLLDDHRDVARRAIVEGNVIASHTWSHSTLTTIPPHRQDEELQRADEAVRRAGSASTCIRPPWGATDAGVEDRIAAHGLRRVLWNVDTEDWRAPSATAIADRLLTDAEPGAVVLLHDGGGDRARTVQALRDALPRLAAEGYVFAIVPGC